MPDIELIADRKAALERRVVFLEELHGEAGVAVDGEGGRDRALPPGPAVGAAPLRPEGEALPLVLDECFLHLRADRKWAMLDLIDRLSAHAQVIYLTDDADVSTWARRRSATGAIAFLDPLRQPITA